VISLKKVHVWISGLVIGVGFRYFVRVRAKELGLKGWVKNSGEMVEALFEGPEDDIKKMLNLCREGPASANVKDVKVDDISFTKDDHSCRDAFCVKF
jgi:acylphosphatase